MDKDKRPDFTKADIIDVPVLWLGDGTRTIRVGGKEWMFTKKEFDILLGEDDGQGRGL